MHIDTAQHGRVEMKNRFICWLLLSSFAIAWGQLVVGSLLQQQQQQQSQLIRFMTGVCLSFSSS
jgi:hypothetical protein